MGRMALAQFQESMPATTKYHALVRSEEEAEKLRFDLAGVKLVQGELVLAKPTRLDGISIIVCAANSDATTLDEAFQTAFSGVTLAMLCDAGHSEIVPTSDGQGVEVSVPPEADKVSSFRLLAEISGLVKCVQREEAAEASGSRLKHVLMRSTMGVSCMERCATAENDVDSSFGCGLTDAADDEDVEGRGAAARCDLEAEAALEKMGGRATLYGKLMCERALATSGLPHTILRLGALTDDAGMMVPLRFGGGGDDALLLEHTASGGHRGEPPMLSRADAARVAIELLRNHPAPCGEVIDCAWAARWGGASAGTEESQLSAARQHRTLIDDARAVASR